MRTLYLIVTLALSVLCSDVFSQRRTTPNTNTTSNVNYDSTLFGGISWRSIGPFRGGRSAAVTGVQGQPNVYYFGATGGGVWKTTDAGNSWFNVSDGFFGGSIGAVAVSESDPNIIYVGGGEKTVRGNVSHGYGVWKSDDAGKNWRFMGLPDSRHIPRIRIHPKNPDIVYAAVLGHLFGPSDERGIYRSLDGGKTWKQVLFANRQAGAVDLIIDPSNPRVLYASTWRVIRTPYSLESGGEGSALWKSIDGGDTWQNISRNKGLPQKSILGIIGITVSPKNPDRLWAIVEAADGGVFRSDDAGKTWTKVNEDRSLRQRAWYYTRIYADTHNEDMVYVLNVNFHRSKDGGKTYQTIATPHGDHHDLWISAANNHHIIIADDGGAQVSLDQGANFSTYMNQPTAQFYRVVTDNHFPYRIYGAQQDNSTVRIFHRKSSYGGLGERDWEKTAGYESGHLAPHPITPDIVYGGNYGGYISRIDHRTDEERVVSVWPDNPMGDGAKAMKYRFQWNFPIFFSPHDPNVLYAAGNHLFRSTNEGQSWEPISPDLTTNDTTRQGSSGGPITKDNTSVEYYCTIFAACESPYEKGLIWAGSDDGLLHITRDGGKNWENVTPPRSMMPEWMMFNSIEPHPFVKGGAYVAATRYKSDDFTPYLYRTLDYGKTWTLITRGIHPTHFTRVLRADPVRPGLLFAGTENGMYISFNDGANWQRFQLNLPVVPITDMTIKNEDLIVATQGRSFWLIDDISPLRMLKPEMRNANLTLFTPRPTYRILGGGGAGSRTEGENLQAGVLVHFNLKNAPDSTQAVSLSFYDEAGKLIRQYSSNAKERSELLEAKAGGNRFVWNMRYPDAERFEGLILWAGGTQGPLAMPGNYTVKLRAGKDSAQANFQILKDPRSQASPADLKAQFDFLIEVRDKLTETHRTIKTIRSMKEQMNNYSRQLDKKHHNNIIQNIEQLSRQLSTIEETLYQTKNRSGQDPLNFPIRLNNKLSALVSDVATGNFRPTDQSVAVKNEITAQIDAQLDKFKTLVKDSLPALNQMIKEAGINAIVVPQEVR